MNCGDALNGIPHPPHEWRVWDGSRTTCDGVWPATVALPGSVSTGTLKPDDLINAFLPVLRDIDNKTFLGIAARRPHGSFYVSTGDYYTDLNEYVVELIDTLDRLAPKGYHFGTLEGDGSDFGFWENFPEEDEEPAGDESDEEPESNTLIAAKGMIEVYPLLTPNLQERFFQAYVSANEVVSEYED